MKVGRLADGTLVELPRGMSASALLKGRGAVARAGADALEAGDVRGWLDLMSSHRYRDAVYENLVQLEERGLLEQAWLLTYQSGRPHTVAREIAWLLPSLDRAKLQAAGDPFPDGRLTLYRGVCGRGRARVVRGLSWTGTLDCARWFAGRGLFGGGDQRAEKPAVFQVQVDSANILARLTDRREDEYLVDPAALPTRPKLLELVSKRRFKRAHTRWRIAAAP